MVLPKNKTREKSVFISRDLGADSPFRLNLQKHNSVLVDESLIRISRIPFSHTPKTKWVFFSSRNSIKHFFAQAPQLLPDVKFGVLSQPSASYLNSFGKQADFTGEGVDLLKIARNFRDTIGDDSVLFPQAMDSLQTIQQQLSFTNTVFNLYTYKTILRTDIEIPYTDILIFTSPSNVSAYYNKYQPDARQVVIAIGSTTKQTLRERGIKNVFTPTAFDEDGLYDVLQQNDLLS